MTATLPDADTVTAEDVEVPCEIVMAVMRRNRRGVVSTTTRPQPCKNPARYHGLMPCCGEIVLACEDHATDGQPFWCHKCQVDTPSHRMNWQRL